MHRDEEKGGEPLASKTDHSGYPGHHNVRSGHASLFARWFDSFLRILTFLGTLAALIVLLKSNQEIGVQDPRVPGGIVYVKAKWRYADAFKYFLAANAAVAGYSLLLALLTFFNKHGSLFLFFLDFIASSLLISAASSATAMAYLGYRGNNHVEWAPICGKSMFRHFCYRVAGSILASYIAWLALALSTVLTAYRLRHKQH